MKLTAPKFWYEKPGLFSTLLSPASALYNFAQDQKQSTTAQYKSTIPVICIGNITIGGSGKTPVVQALIELVKKENIASNPCILSRGYGGSKDIHLVKKEDTYQDVGDEPKLLSQYAPVIVAKNRADGAKLAENHDFDLIIMDDGFQNQTLYKDISFLVVDGTIGFGNQKLLPAGPLRESIERGLKRTNAIILINEDTYGVQNLITDHPLIKANIRPQISPSDLKATKYIAFCGIAHPEKFKRTLKEITINLIDFKSYPDHYKFTEADVKNLMRLRTSDDVRFITTEKDYVRLLSFEDFAALTDTLPIRLEIENNEALLNIIRTEGTA